MNGFLDSLNYGQWILHALVLLPVAGIPLVLLAPERLARHVALGVPLLTFVVSAGLWWQSFMACPAPSIHGCSGSDCPRPSPQRRSMRS